VPCRGRSSNGETAHGKSGADWTAHSGSALIQISEKSQKVALTWWSKGDWLHGIVSRCLGT
jgi:hypothetical protein